MGKKNLLERRYAKWGYIFSIPFMVAFLLFQFWPIAKTILLAFTDLRGAGNTEWHFLTTVGKPWYECFKSVLTSNMFQKAFANTFYFWIVETVPEWILALWLAAVMTDRRYKLKGKMAFRTIYFLPKLVSGVTLGALFLTVMLTFLDQFFEKFFTIVALDGFGIQFEDVKFLVEPQFWIIIVNLYIHFGATFVYFYAGISGIPLEIFEAAEIDGANRFQTFFRVTLPCMKPIVLFVAVMSILDGLGMWEIVSALGYDQDGTNATTTIMIYIRNQAFAAGFYGRASAASVILLAIYAVVCGFAFFLLRDKDEAELKKLRRIEAREARKSGKELKAITK